MNSVIMSTVSSDGSGGPWSGEEGDSMKGIIPLNRMGTSLDVANAVAFLLSPKSRYITGESIVLSGGLGLRL